jgi:WD40 repeat protein
MTTTAQALANPYVGPRSFQTGEALYGRDRELRDLLGLLIAERIVLLHSPSGAGKTSLVQAALVPELREHDFNVLPVMRVSLEPPSTTTDHRPPTTEERGSKIEDHNVNTIETRSAILDPRASNNPSVVGRQSSVVGNRYVLSLLLSLEEGLPPEQQLPLDTLARMSFAEYLAQRPANGAGDGDVLIFDQFEEILTVDPANRAAKAAFFVQIGAALRDRRLWALFSMREDYVAALAPYLRYVPTRLDNTYHLDLLGAEGARQAIQQPARSQGVEFDDAVAIRLIDDLRRIHVQRSDGSMEEQLGPSVEPVQLQVVCYRLWDRRFGAADQLADEQQQGADSSDGRGDTSADQQELPIAAIAARDGASTPAVHSSFDQQRITAADLEAVGDVNTALADYYAERVAGIATATGLSERRIREWFDRELITQQGIRGQVLQGEGRSQGLENQAIWTLIDAYLVRAEKRRGATWFELAHDRLIEPVRANNAAWRAANLTQLQRQADLWNTQSRPDGLLLRDAALVEAEQWAAAHAGDLTQVENDFLDQCRKVREIVRRARRNNRVIRALLVATIILASGAILLFFQARQEAERADQQATIARQNEQKAREQQLRAEQQTRVATAHGLAAAALATLETNPELSILLARQAVRATTASGEPVEADAQEMLQRAVQASRLRHTFNESSEVNSVAFSPDGRRLAIATNREDNAVIVRDADTGAELETLTGHTAPVWRVTYSPDGTRLASASYDNTARVWDATTGKQLGPPIEHTNFVFGIAFSPDGTRLATAGADGTLIVSDVATGAPKVSLPQPGAVLDLAYSPDGKRLAVAAYSSGAIVWDGPSYAVSRTFDLGMPVYSVAFSPDGAQLVTGGENGTIKVWDAATGAELRTLTGHTNTIYQTVFSHDGAFLATASADKTVRVWNPDTGQLVAMLAGHTGSVNGIALSADGSFLASASVDTTARTWSLGLLNPAEVKQIVYSPDGKRLATAGTDAARLWDAGTGALLRTFSSHDGSTSVAFSPDGKRLATAGQDNTVSIWDAGSGRELRALPAQSDLVYRVVFSPDGRLLATVGNDKTARIWDATSGQELRKFTDHTEWVYGVAFSPDGKRLATAGQDSQTYVWDVASGARQLALTAPGRLYSVVFSPDGARLATASEDGHVYLWDALSGTQVLTLTGHTGPIYNLAFSPDGKRLATASSDQTVRVWAADSGQQLFTLPYRAEVEGVAFSPDGKYLATSGADGSSQVYPLDLDALLKLASERVTRELTPQECQTYHVGEAGQCPPAP